mmetsp:Transcript_4362/g.7715  ORF Transcript_4362/g.7715 Transcript_4362/m.7715 type:complete len:426 (+) Transcript_4362:112-1389(+)|eukprot:CAMPEP_0197663316 /NCGR_PEP_ID=MMETSP1338-20131121/56939_1 /TAXON_ID=43686 ORGANISM="Pelagodinium beii, Strain RCC1491" /NCGR_SAMPLE_ID=MMETSP1338 /ASSEMBLY_ACC=CAM_ASM_000754 /LENGTH=425 /DNA_ID=CAMNT_0043241617 /DNA_START=97 /DNA_END=1374 /DNA_ORIENTATION=-
MDPPWSSGTTHTVHDAGWAEEVEDDAEYESEALANPAIVDTLVARTVDDWACYLIACAVDDAALESFQDAEEPKLPEAPSEPAPTPLVGIAGFQEQPSLDEPFEDPPIRLLSPTSATSSDGGSKGTQWLYKASDSKDFWSADDGDINAERDDSLGMSALHWGIDRDEDPQEDVEEKEDVNLPDMDEEISIPRRPVVAAGRPETRGNRGSLLSQPPVAPSFTGESRGGDGTQTQKKGRRIVYVDHHHVHHHHHFHQPGDWPYASPGELPPEAMRRRQEKKTQADVEQKAGPLENSAAPPEQVKVARLPATRALPGRVRRHARQRNAGKQKGNSVAIDGSFGNSLLADLPGPNVFGETSKFAEDKSSRFKASFVNDVSLQLSGSVAAEQKATGKDNLPLQQYFQLMARLPLENRLKLSPYGVPLSAR